MTKSIATIKEEILEEFDDRFQWSQNSSYVFVNKRKELVRIFLSQSLDHIASVARQEGREEARRDFVDMLKEKPGELGWSRAFNERLLAKLTGKEEKV